MMTTKTNLIIDQGASFAVELALTNVNGDPILLEGYQANSQIRKWYTSINAAATFATSINTESGSIVLSLSANQTSNLISGRYVYDVEINANNIYTRIVEGIITVTPEVTR